jgi:diguanylate cyclase (GGDEF)-like protein/PAS domain S-box-containing protein
MTTRRTKKIRARKERATDALLASSRIALDSAAQGVCVYDADNRIVLFNHHYVDLFDLSHDVIRPGMTYREVMEHSAARGNFAPEAIDGILRERYAMIAAGVPFSTQQLMPSGLIMTIDIRPLPEGGWLAVCDDITSRSRLESALALQTKRIELAVAHMSHGLSMYAPDERLIVCNEQYLSVYGLDPAVVKPGITHREVIEHWVSRGNAAGRPAEEVYNQRMTEIRRGDCSVGYLTRGDGRTVQALSSPMPDGGWVSACEDVTERLLYEDQLKQQNQLLDAALENMAHGLCVYDSDMRLRACNTRYREIYGLTPEEAAPGTHLADLVKHAMKHGAFSAQYDADQIMTAAQASIISKDTAILHRRMSNGSLIAVCYRPLPDGGFVATYEDVTERLRHEDQLKQQNMLFDAALENMAQGLCVYGKDMRLKVCNSRFREIYGLSQEDTAPGTHLSDTVVRIMEHGTYSAEHSIEQIMAVARASIDNGDNAVLHRRLSNGKLLVVRYQPLPDGGFVATYEDITERERTHEEISEQHRRFDAALNNMSQGLCMLDDEFRVTVFNKRYLDIYGLSPEIVKPGIAMREIMDKSCALGNHPGTTAQALYDGYVAQLRSGEYKILRHLGDGRIIRLNHSPMEQGGWVVTYEDITERHKAQARVAHMAQHDALTDLPNRALFRERMTEGLEQVDAQGAAMALLCLDLDNFKTVNDRLGHAIGDQLLCWVADRLRECVGPHDTVARLGGDEFAVLQCGPQPQSAEHLARRLVDIVSRPPSFNNQLVHSGISIGIAVSPRDGRDAEHLMKAADLALYQAKSNGRNGYEFFRPEMEQHSRLRHLVEVDLRGALEAGEFHLAYQSQLRVDTGELTGFEALLRWTSAKRGPVSPAEFIPIAEQTGMIVPLGEWVLRTACAAAAKWPDAVKIAVNLSPMQFRARGLAAMVTSALAATGLAPHRLELEVTESALLEDDAATIAILHQLRALGIRVSMDDFGVGYSSLSYLRKFPFDKIKIDRSFVGTLGESSESKAIVRTIASLGQNLGMETTAEGIETAEQLDLVRQAGCTEAQGYYFSRPCPIEDAFRIIEEMHPVSRVA